MHVEQICSTCLVRITSPRMRSLRDRPTLLLALTELLRKKQWGSHPHQESDLHFLLTSTTPSHQPSLSPLFLLWRQRGFYSHQPLKLVGARSAGGVVQASRKHQVDRCLPPKQGLSTTPGDGKSESSHVQGSDASSSESRRARLRGEA